MNRNINKNILRKKVKKPQKLTFAGYHASSFLSQSINTIKRLDDPFATNYSDYQLILTLDTFIYKALEPLLCTQYLEVRLLDLFFSAPSMRVKPYNGTPDKFYSYLLRFMIAPKHKKIAALKKAKLNRGILFALLKETNDKAQELYPCYLFHPRKLPTKKYIKKAYAIKRTERHFGFKPGKNTPENNLWSNLKESEFWYKQAVQFKQKIIAKYYRYAMMSTIRLNGNSGFHNIDLDDTFQNHVVAIAYALDKFDSERGTLSSYIMNWFMMARNQTSHFVVSPETQSIELIDLDDSMDTVDRDALLMESSVEDTVDSVNKKELLHEIIKIFDKNGEFLC